MGVLKEMINIVYGTYLSYHNRVYKNAIFLRQQIFVCLTFSFHLGMGWTIS